MKKTKDLSPKSPAKVKGGKIAINDNITLLRAAREQTSRQIPKGRS